jgi:hypothetical protein
MITEIQSLVEELRGRLVYRIGVLNGDNHSLCHLKPDNGSLNGANPLWSLVNTKQGSYTPYDKFLPTKIFEQESIPQCTFTSSSPTK